MIPEAQPHIDDILSEDEERALCLVREAVAAARSGCAPAGTAALEAFLAHAGVLVDVIEEGAGAFRFRSARFTIRTPSEPQGCFELCFVPDQI